MVNDAVAIILFKVVGNKSTTKVEFLTALIISKVKVHHTKLRKYLVVS